MPATEKHLLKYSKQEFCFFNETPDDYEQITLPHIKENQNSVQVRKGLILFRFHFQYPMMEKISVKYNEN